MNVRIPGVLAIAAVCRCPLLGSTPSFFAKRLHVGDRCRSSQWQSSKGAACMIGSNPARFAIALLVVFLYLLPAQVNANYLITCKVGPNCCRKYICAESTDHIKEQCRRTCGQQAEVDHYMQTGFSQFLRRGGRPCVAVPKGPKGVLRRSRVDRASLWN